jgi:hypothetical protein
VRTIVDTDFFTKLIEFADFTVKVLSEDDTPLAGAKASSLIMKITCPDSPDYNVTNNPDRKNPTPGVFHFT